MNPWRNKYLDLQLQTKHQDARMSPKQNQRSQNTPHGHNYATNAVVPIMASSSQIAYKACLLKALDKTQNQDATDKTNPGKNTWEEASWRGRRSSSHSTTATWPQRTANDRGPDRLQLLLHTPYLNAICLISNQIQPSKALFCSILTVHLKSLHL